MMLKFMGKNITSIFSHANNLQNPIVKFIVEKPINFNNGGIRRKQVFFRYDNVAKTKDSWAFMKEVLSLSP
jgi:hypothetical protein